MMHAYGWFDGDVNCLNEALEVFRNPTADPGTLYISHF